MSDFKRGVFGDFLYTLSNKNYKTLRLSSMVLDHMIMTFVILIPSFILMFFSIKLEYRFEFFLWPIILFIYMNKDFVKGQSISKRILGYKIVKLNTQKEASMLQCYFRNITIPLIWPVEVVISYFSTTRRIGDYISGTEVVKSDKRPWESIFSDMKELRPTIHIIVLIAAGLIYGYIINKFV
ncbi:RDD family protein [Dokdonia sp.]|uniref:RDD family protein n=1 Tax=Dokdonia sp. TaxID=2024995 RepID=UPI0032632FCB